MEAKARNNGAKLWQAEIVVLRPRQARDSFRRPGMKLPTVVIRGPSRQEVKDAEEDGEELSRVAEQAGRNPSTMFKEVRAAASKIAETRRP